jgi:hypothetical protein
MTVTTECWKCFKTKWKATGRFNQNRNGRPRAELICEACGYAFSSGKPDAIAAGEQVQAQAGAAVFGDGTSQPVNVQLHYQPGFKAELNMKTGKTSFTQTHTLANDWKSRQAGEE